MKFEIKNFFRFNKDGKVKAGFTVETEGGMYYDCKLVEWGDDKYFVASNQSREYTKSDGQKGYARAFGAQKGTPAARFFDDVATQAAAMLKVQQTFKPQPQDDDDDPIPF